MTAALYGSGHKGHMASTTKAMEAASDDDIDMVAHGGGQPAYLDGGEVVDERVELVLDRDVRRGVTALHM